MPKRPPNAGDTPPGHLVNGAGAYDLTDLKKQGQLASLVQRFQLAGEQLRDSGLDTRFVLLTARFEVLVALFASALQADPEKLILDVEISALERALTELDNFVAATSSGDPT